MHKNSLLGAVLAGGAAGIVTGLFGAGGGMVLVPLLTVLTGTKEESLFPTSLSIILPICLISITIAALSGSVPWRESVPYLIGSSLGGIAAGLCGQKIPVLWLHRLLGILILWGGIRYLC